VTFNEWINFNLLTRRVSAACVAILSGIGLLLAVLGLFGTVSYSVSERKKEFGIRVALGAQRWTLLKMVFRQTFVIAVIGIVIGVFFGEGATILLHSQFYGIGCGSHAGQILRNLIEQAAEVLPECREERCPR
jgi:ABC-type antimicrobial peptide transport system permease subunit